MRNVVFLLLLSLVVLLQRPSFAGTAAAGTTAEGLVSSEELGALINGLGDADYHRRESAANQLKMLGPAAVDALLAAAETSADLEVSLRARWLVDAIPLAQPSDPPAVAAQLEAFRKGDLRTRVMAMRRLLRLEDDAGIEPLARLVRLDRSPASARMAAAMLAAEWQAGAAYWPGMAERIRTGLGGSQRPAARFLSGLIGFTTASGVDTRELQLAAATAAVESLAGQPAEAAQPPAVQPEGEVALETHAVFERCLIRMLIAAGRRDQALAKTRLLLAASAAPGRDDETIVVETVEMLIWAVEQGLPEVVDELGARADVVASQPLLGLAAAVAERARGNMPRAESLANAAFSKAEGSFTERLQAAIMLARWGCIDWAVRGYGSLIDDPKTPPGEFSLAAIMYSEFLHDLGRDDEAARCLESLLSGRGGAKDGGNDPAQWLQQLGRDPRSTRSRMHFFEACAAAAKGDAAGRREAVERAIAAYPKDVDALIELYRLSDNTPKQKSDAVARITTALAQIESEIEAVPEDANGYNEYAWLVANTEGDISRATRYSRVSLSKAFDNPSYLDTLAHCQAAAGKPAAAVRTQLIAQRQEPHNQTIRRNLERFEKFSRQP
jgi:hypothetical protein